MLVLEGGEEAEGWLTAAQEKGAIKNLLEATEEQLKEGDTFYLLAYRWWKQWQDYVEDDCNSNNPEPLAAYYFKSCDESISRRPPTIDNSELVVDPYTEDVEAQLQSTLVESQDYILVPEKVWKALHKWYGGGPVLPRKVIAMGAEQQIDLQVEVYPLQLRLVANPEGNQTIVNISKKETIACLYERVCKLFNLSFEQVRLWNYYGRTKHKLLGDFGQTLQDASLQMGQEILSEVCVNGKWPEDEVCLVNGYGSMGRNLSVLPSNNSCSTLSIAGGPIGSKVLENNSAMRHSLSPLDISKEDDTYYGCASSSGRSGPKGLTGLHNLGNTCFMNSALQCLVHTPQLVEFFLQDYIKEINRENPLGMEGELAIAFGELLRKLWAPGRTPVAPRPFKTKLARFAPQFSGYNQHDSQELLAFLLDGLHEDLNRLKNKPYIEVKDVEGRSDEEVADEYWANHRARNDSIIVDVYQGQYKSTLVCPVCGEVSVTFDPFMYLSLPLPSKAVRAMTVVVFCGDGSAPPTSYTINVPKQGKYKDLVNAIGGACSLQSDEKLLMIQLSGLRNFRLVEEPASISSIHDDDRLAAYRLPKVSDRQPLLVLLQHRSEDDYYSLSNAKQWRLFGLPLITCVREDRPCTGADVKAAVEQVLCPMKKPGRAQELDYRDNKSMHEEGPEMLEREPFSDKIPSNNGGTSSLCWEGHSPHRTPFLLSITDERGSSREILMDQHIISPVSSVRSNQRFRYFAVDWSDEALESQYDLSCIERLPEVCKADTPSTYKKARQEAVSLYNCLEAFLKEEPLGPEDMWYCPRCKEHRQASKKLDLWRLPEILVVHLKRFSYNRYLKNKLETFVNFPIHDLDLTRYVASKASSDHYLYDLYAVSNHYGSMGAGHYTAHAKLFDDNKWYNFDDNHVTPANEDEIKTSAAYVLFYRRKHGEKGLKNDVINGCLEQRNFVDVSNQGKVNKPYSFGSGLENPRLLSVSATSNMMLD